MPHAYAYPSVSAYCRTVRQSCVNPDDENLTRGGAVRIIAASLMVMSGVMCPCWILSFLTSCFWSLRTAPCEVRLTDFGQLT